MYYAKNRRTRALKKEKISFFIEKFLLPILKNTGD